MATRSLLGGVATAVLVAVVLVLVAGQLLGQPMLLGYVTSDSMEPALSAGDGFVAVPTFIAGEPSPGDVVVFEARTVQGGGLTTHRIVAETDRGYVTKGDANPFTDQDGGEPPVARGQIVAHALQVDGAVVAIPHLGTAIVTVRRLVAAPFALLGTENVGTVLVFVGIALFVLAGTLGEGGRRVPARSRSRENVVAVWAIVLLAAGVVAVSATAAMVVPAGGYDAEVVATGDPPDDPLVVRPGETATVDYEVHNAGVIPVLVVTEPADEGVSVDPGVTVLGYGERTRVTVDLAAPAEPGRATRRVRESRYLLVLPRRLLLALHSVHPALAIFAVDVVAVGFVVAAAVAVFGTGYLRLRPGPDVPLRVRIERRLRRFR